MAEAEALEEATLGAVNDAFSPNKTRPEAGRIRPAKARASLVGSGRVRRHPHRSDRSVPLSGVSHGPRASWVRVPEVINTINPGVSPFYDPVVGRVSAA